MESVKELGKPGDAILCECGKTVWLNWGVAGTEHLSTWMNPEKCDHFICVAVSKKSFIQG